jgi:hypothetical protein
MEEALPNSFYESYFNPVTKLDKDTTEKEKCRLLFLLNID